MTILFHDFLSLTLPHDAMQQLLSCYHVAIVPSRLLFLGALYAKLARTRGDEHPRLRSRNLTF